jgi:hypothetical protein
MSYEEENTCHMLLRVAGPIMRRIHACHEEEDTCHMRRRIHVI